MQAGRGMPAPIAHPKTLAGALCAAAFMSCMHASAGDLIMGTEADIRAALAGRTAFEAGKAYRPWRQFFGNDGSTTYFAEGPSSVGAWEVRDGQYCSVWPPAQDWVCYDVELSPRTPPHAFIVWIAPDGARTAADIFDGDRTAERASPSQ
jgi:hypothetical protein